MKNNKRYKLFRQILALLLAAVLVLTCTGCTTMQFTAAGSEKLASEPTPERATSGKMWYTFSFTAEQANDVFFGDEVGDCRPMYNFCGYEIPESNRRKRAQWFFFTEAHDGEYNESSPEAVLGGAHNPYRMTFTFFDAKNSEGYKPFPTFASAFEPEAGTLLTAVQQQPVGDAMYEYTLSDSAAKLQALGYSDVLQTYSSRWDSNALRILYRAEGLAPTNIPLAIYVVRYTLQTADIPAAWSDALAANNMATATFYYRADGTLYYAFITTQPEYETTESADVRYTAEEAFRLLPDEWQQNDCILVDAYLEPLPPEKGSESYADCWTFRFVAPPPEYNLSDAEAEAMLEILGITGRYLEMQCHVNAYTGEVTGGEWGYSKHLIHEYNNENVLLQ